MSGTFPTVGFETLDFQSNVQNRLTVAVSGKAQRIRLGAQYWSFKLKSPAMTRADFMTAYSFVIKQDGQYGSFTIVPPTIASTRGTATGTITVNATVAAGQLICNTTGGTGTLKKGDLIKFSNHDKDAKKELEEMPLGITRGLRVELFAPCTQFRAIICQRRKLFFFKKSRPKIGFLSFD